MGTAVNVQTMVFGNMGEDSATGVMFTRNPATGGENHMYGEFLVNAQGGKMQQQELELLKILMNQKGIPRKL